MAYVDWMIKGPKIVTCNCNYGCPCEFNAPPTREVCEGFDAMEIEEGYFGDVRLDGLRFAGTYHWPGPVHEGNGVVQGVIDGRASRRPVQDSRRRGTGADDAVQHLRLDGRDRTRSGIRRDRFYLGHGGTNRPGRGA
jgi:hypothetical protein